MYLRIFKECELLEQISEKDLQLARDDDIGLFEVLNSDNVLQYCTDGTWKKLDPKKSRELILDDFVVGNDNEY